ncbi:hypothetical protein GQ457_05G020490 [Hibiscus cannabinus]
MINQAELKAAVLKSYIPSHGRRAYQQKSRIEVKDKDLKPKRIKDYLECKISQRNLNQPRKSAQAGPVFSVWCMTRANPKGPRFDYDSELERTQRRLKKEIRNLMNKNNGQQPADGQELPARADGVIAPPAPQMNQQMPARTVRDYLAEDLEGLNPAVTMPDFEAEHFELKPVMFNMLNTLGQFGGTPNENARQHVRSFLEICNSFKIHGVSNDVLKLKLFPYSLRDKAKTWLNNLQPGSLQSWTQLCRSFLAKFSYTNMTDHLRNQITSFRQEDNEAMHEAWERYRDLYRRCPMHGLPEWTQVSIFYNSVNTPTRMMLDASANGTLLDKPPQEGKSS